jgi:cystathionine beta-lyase/cystathionine gamma-synthase
MDYAEPSWFIRLFIGMEDVEDLKEDISAALKAFK